MLLFTNEIHFIFTIFVLKLLTVYVPVNELVRYRAFCDNCAAVLYETRSGTTVNTPVDGLPKT